jgi:AcrR family transcriptional regulator
VRQRPKPPKREEEVIAAATRIFYERGYTAATVQEVADELGINKGSLYYYIRTKDDLLDRIFDKVHEDVEALLASVAAADDLDALERINLYVRGQIEYSLDHADTLYVYQREMDHLTGSRLDQVRDRRRQHDYILTRLIQEAQREGLVDSGLHTGLLTNCLFAVLISTHRWYRPGGRVSRQMVIDECAGFVMRGIACRGPAGEPPGLPGRAGRDAL